MQFLEINESTTFEELVERVGERNIEYILAANDLTRTPNIGQVFSEKCLEVMRTAAEVDWQRQINILNTLTSSADIFENAALLSQSEWKILSTLGTFLNMLKIPESIVLPDATDILGSEEGVLSSIYKKAMEGLKGPSHSIDPGIFNEYSTIHTSQIISSNHGSSHSASDPFQWFQLPWGKITLYSSLSGESKEFPVYPEDLSDSVSANYTEMPGLLFQYEPWYVYQSSGPRSNSYTFKFHRDMWSGDHRDGKANELIRFCKANCYPEYNGSAVNTSTVSLYIDGVNHVTGIITKVEDRWSGPIGQDGFYLYCELTIDITEVSTTPLSYQSEMSKGLIG